MKLPFPPTEDQLVNTREILHSSESAEWYTPRYITDAARAVMGGIDLDPASSAAANQSVGALDYIPAAEDGLAGEWYGRVWLNPPYGKTNGVSNQALWSRVLIAEYDAGRVKQAVLLVSAVPSNRWFQPLWRFPICFHCPRIKFISAGGTGHQPTNSNALIYLGDRVDRFVDVFSAFGHVVLPCS